MAFNNTIDCGPRRWTQLTQADVSALRAENQGGYGLYLQATSDATEPSSVSGSVHLGAWRLLAADLTLQQLWPGVTDAARVWAYNPRTVTIPVSVSHA